MIPFDNERGKGLLISLTGSAIRNPRDSRSWEYLLEFASQKPHYLRRVQNLKIALEEGEKHLDRLDTQRSFVDPFFYYFLFLPTKEALQNILMFRSIDPEKPGIPGEFVPAWKKRIPEEARDIYPYLRYPISLTTPEYLAEQTVGTGRLRTIYLSDSQLQHQRQYR